MALALVVVVVVVVVNCKGNWKMCGHNDASFPASLGLVPALAILTVFSLLFFLHRYTLAAQDLVMRARGVLKDRGWRISNDRLGSGDDISVYVIPLIHGNKLS